LFFEIALLVEKSKVFNDEAKKSIVHTVNQETLSDKDNQNKNVNDGIVINVIGRMFGKSHRHITSIGSENGSLKVTVCANSRVSVP